MKITVKLADKYPRSHFLEIISTTGFNLNRCEKIIKKLINKKKIRGKFDNVNKGIEFEFVNYEIEQLTKNFEDWEDWNGKKTLLIFSNITISNLE